MKLLKHSFLTLFVVSSLGVVAQRPDYEDLNILYAEGKYDKLIKKSEKYQDKDDSKYDPLPYLYMSMAFFEISNDEAWIQKDDSYKRAYSNSLRYAAQFRKKLDRLDNEAEKIKILSDNNEYLQRLKGAIMEDVDLYLNQEDKNYRKAVGELKRLVTFAPDDAGAYLLKGVCEYRARNKTISRMDFDSANVILEKINFKLDIMRMEPNEELSDIENWKYEIEHNPTARMLMHGLIEAAKLWEEERNHEEAVRYINIGFPWFQNYDFYKEHYDKIVNG